MTDNIKIKKTNQIIIWVLALILGAFAGCLRITALNHFFDFIATVFTRLFQFVAIPTIALAVITTLSELGHKKDTGKIFGHTLFYTLLTTFCAAITGLLLYILFTPDNITLDITAQNAAEVSTIINNYSK